MISNARITFCITSRLRSTRCPSKAFAYLGRKPLVEHTIERVSLTARTLQQAFGCAARLIVAVPEHDYQAYTALARQRKWHHTYAADVQTAANVAEEDVLQRIVDCVVDNWQSSHLVRVTGDCPFWCPRIGVYTVTQSIVEDVAYGTNDTDSQTYTHCPDGTDVEVINTETLLTAHRLAQGPDYREHPTKWVQDFTRPFLVRATHQGTLLKLKLSVDTVNDLLAAQRLMCRLEALGTADDESLSLRHTITGLSVDQGGRYAHRREDEECHSE